MRFVPDEIEALIALGRLDEAEALLDRLEGRARGSTGPPRSPRPAAAAVCSRPRAATPMRALARCEKALAEHERVSMPFEQARTLLALGATRRRAKMKRPAREALEQALAALRGARRARSGPRWRAPSSPASAVAGRRPGELTPTERRIAALAAEGRSNKEIATALFVTPKTVGTQLSRIYRKVGVHSRTELARRLSETPKV